MIKVSINGYGTIGKRVADAVAAHKDMKVIGVSKTRRNVEAFVVKQRGFQHYIADIAKKGAFEKAGLTVAESVEDMCKLADVIVDTTPADIRATNKLLYEALGKKVLWEGGEDHKVAGFSFKSSCNLKDDIEKLFARVILCSTTGLCRRISIIGGRPQIHNNKIQGAGSYGREKDTGESTGGGKKPIGFYIAEILNKLIILLAMFIAIKVVEVAADILWREIPPFVKILILVANAFLLVLLLFYIYETIRDFFKKES